MAAFVSYGRPGRSAYSISALPVQTMSCAPDNTAARMAARAAGHAAGTAHTPGHQHVEKRGLAPTGSEQQDTVEIKPQGITFPSSIFHPRSSTSSGAYPPLSTTCHARHAAAYAIKATAAAVEVSGVATGAERDWQYRRLPQHLRAAVFPVRGDT